MYGSENPIYIYIYNQITQNTPVLVRSQKVIIIKPDLVTKFETDGKYQVL